MSPQSSLYSDEGLGVTVLSTLYGAVLLSSMLLPPLLIRALGCKWTIVLSMGCYVAFSLGNFYASWYPRAPPSCPGSGTRLARPWRPCSCFERARLLHGHVRLPLPPPPGPRVPSAPPAAWAGLPPSRDFRAQ